MKPSSAWPLSALLLLLLGACQATPAPDASPRPSGPRIELEDQPQSSLAALIRILEAIDALHDPEVEVRIRALECDTLPSRRDKPPHVRVVLDLTLYALDYEVAERAREALHDGLVAEGQATERLQAVAPYRVQRVFEEMPWNAPRVHSERDFAGLVSVSDSLQVDVFEPVQRERAALGELAELEPTLQSIHVQEYIASSAERLSLGPLQSSATPRRLRDQRTDLSYRIRPLYQEDSFRRHQIGAFLAELESGSPGVRITHLEIAPSDPGEDVRHDLWSFEADLTLRLTR